MDQFMIAIAIFLATYALIVVEKWNRAVIALLGAVLMILFGMFELHYALAKYVEWNTITLLIGMMILVIITNETGVFQYLALKLAKKAKGIPIRILIYLSLLTAIASALLDNVTSVLLIIPITVSISNLLKINPIPFFIAEIIASNVGGTATLIGDPPNIMIGSANPHLTFNAFLLNTAPVVLIILPIILLIFYLIYRKHFRLAAQDETHRLFEVDELQYIKNPALVRKALVVLSLTILGFVLHSFIHVEASVVAITGAIILMLIGVKGTDVEKTFQSIEWVSIFFFIGLFILVGGLQEAGVIRSLSSKLLAATQGDLSLTAIYLLWGSGILSGVVDNIPFVATMIPLIKNMAVELGLAVDSFEINVLWWSLSLGACFGGNATIIGASANVVVAGLAENEGHKFSFWDFFKLGFPITLLCLAISHVYIYFRYLIFLS